MVTPPQSSAPVPPSRLDDVTFSGDRPPLVLIAFTRPDLLRQVILALQQQTVLPSKLIAFVDGARREADVSAIEQCVSLLESCASFFPVKIIRRNQNLGCDQNVIQAFTEVFQVYESCVYLEDDTVPNPFFYDRMCRLLEAYKNQPQICSISGYANLSNDYQPHPKMDFIVSNRVFSLGFGTWRDRWQKFNLVNQSEQFNPFGNYYQIPVTAQTKFTWINQFWIEKNLNTDWVISFTLAALYYQQYHLVPSQSMVHHIGFGHPDAKTYRGKEPAWINARYCATFSPNSLPETLEISPTLDAPLNETKWIQYLNNQHSFWLSPSAFLYLWKNTSPIRNRLLLVQLFLSRLPLMMKRWKGGLPV